MSDLQSSFDHAKRGIFARRFLLIFPTGNACWLISWGKILFSRSLNYFVNRRTGVFKTSIYKCNNGSIPGFLSLPDLLAIQRYQVHSFVYVHVFYILTE